MPTTAHTFQYVFELLGTGFFAVSGALRATDRARPDWFGVTFIGFVTAIGGGSLRDMLLGSYPLVWVSDPWFIYAIFIGIVVARIGYERLLALRRTRLLFDTLGIAMFTILGTEKAIALGVAPLVAAMMGMFSAVMGGVIRDVLTHREPVIFSKEIYATACIAGALLYVLLDRCGVPRELNFCVSGAVIAGVRIIAVKFNLSLPTFPVK
jgi:uncharacterized membrane protein YeiH